MDQPEIVQKAAELQTLGDALEWYAVVLDWIGVDGSPGPLATLPWLARHLVQLKMFRRLGIETTEHFAHRLAQRGARGISEANALDAYRNGRLFFNEATGNFVRHSSRTGISVVTDAPARGRAITVFQGKPSPDWVPVPWRPGL